MSKLKFFLLSLAAWAVRHWLLASLIVLLVFLVGCETVSNGIVLATATDMVVNSIVGVAEVVMENNDDLRELKEAIDHLHQALHKFQGFGA